MNYAKNWKYLEATPESPLQEIPHPICQEKGIALWIKRDDQLQMGDDLGFCGNKWRKLKYNLLAARQQEYTQLLTFGGAFSNHIVATASAGRLFGFQTIGIIRGERPPKGNASLRYAESCGMRLHFVDRTTYRQKTSLAFKEKLHTQFGEFYLLPEGGTNALALQGCQELGHDIGKIFSRRPLYIGLACGTGGTLAGLVQGLSKEIEVIGFSALKGDFLHGEVAQLIGQTPTADWQIETKYHFGGFAKFKPELIEFINDFKRRFDIQLDPVYTGKMMFGLLDKIKKGHFPEGANLIAVHTGGLQGIRGFNERFGSLIE